MIATRTFLVYFVMSFMTYGQSLNTEVTKAGRASYLLGEINREGLQSEPYRQWFQSTYQAYKPQEEVMEALQTSLNDHDILVFMGTWCGDSQREVPRLFKVLETANFPLSNLRLVALDPGPELYKQSPQHEEAGLNIHRVPTIIVYKNGKELQRIVESPVESLEQDLLNICTKGPYNARFELVTAVDKKLKRGAKKLQRAEASLLKNYKDKVSSLYELNTYAKVLRATGNMEEALAVLELNTKFFPENKNVYISLAQQLLSLNRKKEGILALEKAVKLAPEDQALKARLVQLKSK